MKYGWQLDRELWQQLVEFLPDIKWRKVPFNYNHSLAIPKKPGVYLICGTPPLMSDKPYKKFFNVIYAGRSETSIHERFDVHCNRPDKSIQKIKQCYGSREGYLFFYFATLPKELVKPVETQLINCYGPAANQRAGDSITGLIEHGIPAG